MSFGDTRRRPIPTSSAPIPAQHSLSVDDNSRPHLVIFCVSSFAAALIHSSILPLASFTSIAHLLHGVPSIATVIMRSVKLSVGKSRAEATVVRHDEHLVYLPHPTCAICQIDVGTKSPEGIKEGWAVTPCGHLFGSVCIKRYLSITDKPSCPMCRTDLFHMCAHPILAAPYNPKKAKMTREEAATKAFPIPHRDIDCGFCMSRRRKASKRRRLQVMLDTARGGGPASTGSTGESLTDSGSESEPETDSDVDATADAPSVRKTKGLRDTKSSHPTEGPGQDPHRPLDETAEHEDQEDTDSPEPDTAVDYHDDSEDVPDDPEEEDEDLDGDIVVPDTPQLAASRNLPPVPGPYGHWDLANKGPDWSFLAWYDSQDPKMTTTAEHFA